MLCDFLALALPLASVRGHTISQRRLNIRRRATSLPTADALTPFKAAVLQAGVPPLKVVYPPSADSLTPSNTEVPQTFTTSPLIKDTILSSTSISIGFDGKRTSPDVQSQYVMSLQTLAKGLNRNFNPKTTTKILTQQKFKDNVTVVHVSGSISSQTKLTIAADSKSQYILQPGRILSPSSTVTLGLGASNAVSEIQASGSKTSPVKDASASFLKTIPVVLPDIIIGSHTIIADAQNRYILVGGQTLTPGTTTAPGSSNSTTVQALRTANVQTYSVSSSTDELFAHATAPPDVSKILPPVTISGQTMTANSLGQFETDCQTLTPGGALTVSGGVMSLAPDKGGVVMETITDALAPHVSAGSGSGLNVTGVQSFQENALGTRDELCGSLMVIVMVVGVGVAVLIVVVAEDKLFTIKRPK